MRSNVRVKARQRRSCAARARGGAAAQIEEAQLPSRLGVLAAIFDRVNREYLSRAGWWAG